MAYPPGVEPEKGCDCLVILKSLYGLKQSGRNWWLKLGQRLATIRLKRLEQDWGLYYRPPSEDRKKGPIIVLTYVDDTVVVAKTKAEVEEVFNCLRSEWTITTVDKISTILGVKITRDRLTRRLWMNQPGYIERIAKRFEYSTRVRNTPMAASVTSEEQEEDWLTNITPYQEAVGCLQWLATCTRCQDGGCGAGGEATMERVPNRRWTGSMIGSMETVEMC